jgi:hypothetical protein
MQKHHSIRAVLQHRHSRSSHLRSIQLGSMLGLYNPNAGSIDFQNVANNATANGWDVSSIHDPLGFESLFEGMIQGGYSTVPGKSVCSDDAFAAHLTLIVPDEEGRSYL